MGFKPNSKSLSIAKLAAVDEEEKGKYYLHKYSLKMPNRRPQTPRMTSDRPEIAQTPPIRRTITTGNQESEEDTESGADSIDDENF